MPPDPRPPKGLTARSRRLWRESTAALVFEPAELVVLEQLCRTVDLIAAADASIVRDGLLLQGRFGLRSNPATTIRDRNVLLLARLARELGITSLDEVARPAGRR